MTHICSFFAEYAVCLIHSMFSERGRQVTALVIAIAVPIAGVCVMAPFLFVSLAQLNGILPQHPPVIAAEGLITAGG